VASLASLIHLRMRQRDHAPVTVPPGTAGDLPAAPPHAATPKEANNE
jgi:hypothetical protein